MEWLSAVWEFIRSAWPLWIVQPWEGAIHLRLGRVKRVLEPGWYLTIPVLDSVWSTNVLVKPTDCGPLPLTTKDGVGVTVSAVITWEVSDVERFLTECESPGEALHDAASGALAHAVLAHDWVDIPTEPFIAAVCVTVRKACRRYGIRVLQMRWTGACQARPLVVWMVSSNQSGAATSAALMVGKDG